jgi:hypothetical protein
MKNKILIILIILFSSCATTKKIETITEIKTEYIELVKDTTIYIEDMAYFRAYLECDSVNNVVIKELENKAGKLIKQNVKYIDKIIYVEAKIDSQAVYISWIETHNIEKEKEYINVEIIKKVYPTWFIIALIVACLYFIFIIIKKIGL